MMLPLLLFIAVLSPITSFQAGQNTAHQSFLKPASRKYRSHSAPVPHSSRHLLTLSSSTNDDDNNMKQSGKARFSGIQSSPTSFVDSVVSFLVSDVTSIFLGVVGLSICVWNRLSNLDYLDSSAVDVLGQQSRYDILAVCATGAVLLNGVSKLDVTSALASSVVLDGTEVELPVIRSGEGTSILKEEEMKWALKGILDATPARSAVMVAYNGANWNPIAYIGILPANIFIPENTPILNRFLNQPDRKETYLPTLQALPGRLEFTYLPSNAQEALLVPVKEGKVLVLGSDTAKNFTPKDIAWCQLMASRIAAFLE